MLRGFLKRYHDVGGANVALSGDIGADADSVMSHILRLLAVNVEKSLLLAFNGGNTTIPFDVLSCSIAGIHSMILMTWKDGFHDVAPEPLADSVHRMCRALFGEALGESSVYG